VQHPGYKTYNAGETENYFVKGYVKPNEPVVAPDLDASLHSYRAAQLKASQSDNFKIYTPPAEESWRFSRAWTSTTVEAAVPAAQAV